MPPRMILHRQAQRVASLCSPPLSLPRSFSTISSISSTPRRPQPQPQRQPQQPQPQRQQTRPLTTKPPLSQRTVFIHVRPPPQTLAERRAVLRAVERQGKTVLFKKTAANDSFLCVAATTDMADALVKKSPFSYDLADSLATVPFSLSSARIAAARAPAGRSFTVSIFAAAAYPHRTAIRNGPLYGPWPDDIEPMLATSPSFKNTFAYNALRGVVPESASADALCDWRPRIAFATGVSNAPDDGARAVYSHESKVARIRDRRARRRHDVGSVLAGLVQRAQ